MQVIYYFVEIICQTLKALTILSDNKLVCRAKKVGAGFQVHSVSIAGQE